MEWHQKALLQQLIARLPASDALYYALQRHFGDLRDGRFDPMEWLIVAAETVGRLRRSGFSIVGKRCLEVGTGRTIGLPLGLWLCGAKQTVTIDLNRYLSRDLVEASHKHLCRNRERALQILRNADEDGGLEERLERLCQFSGDLDSLLKFIDVQYMAPANATNVPFPDCVFDYHLSYSVLEHVPRPQLAAMLVEARRILRLGGVLVHIFDLSDHFAYTDDSITRINFLRFSDAQWRRWAGNKYMYHNRLRPSEYVKLFEESGVSILLESRAVHHRSLEALAEGFPLHERFQPFPAEELAVGAMRIIGRISSNGTEAPALNSSHPVELKYE